MFETMYFIYGVVVLLLFIPLSIVLIRPALPPLLRAAALTLTLPLRLWRDGFDRTSSEYRAKVPLTLGQYAAIVGLLWLNGLILVIGFSERFDWILPGIICGIAISSFLTFTHSRLHAR
ncbi:MAG: hypothetical protein IT290_06250 [Deltaproteobacteria bacterium]|nr:hypothetical protein [Deltaproteobacteria bacterium]